MDDLDEEFVEIIAAVGPRRRKQIVAAARAVAGELRADADQLGTAAICPSNRPGLKVLGALPQQTFGQSRFWRYQLAAAAEALADDEPLGSAGPALHGRRDGPSSDPAQSGRRFRLPAAAGVRVADGP